MMFKHFIAIASVYSKGVRIAWHYSEETFDNDVMKAFLKRFKRKHGDLQLGIHRISTSSPDWSSVVEADTYFKEVILVQDQDDFIAFASNDRDLTAIDIAKYVLTLLPTTQLKLQKLVYLIYEKHLVNTGVPLFEEPILAWKHGPVTKSLYDEFREYGSNTIPYEEDNTVIITSKEVAVNPSYMRIFSSECGLSALDVIHEIIDEYEYHSAWDLVNLTHRSGSPWEKAYKPGVNAVISDEIILANA